jgi:hypothetical protein
MLMLGMVDNLRRPTYYCEIGHGTIGQTLYI